MKIAVLVSGGVDSAVSLALLKQQGYEVTAVYLKIWLEDELAYLGNCPWQEDLIFVEALCKQFNVKLEIISLQKEYWQTIVSYVIAQVKEGKTPNPDVLCNSHIKFGVFYDVLGHQFDKIATGHYAKVVQEQNKYILQCSPDEIKDQTYFLANLSQQQLQRALFPLGDLTKAHVRALAAQFDLANKDRKDSQGICFLGTIKFREFIKHHLGEKVGDIVEFETGRKLGTHQGFWFYTIGQRYGLRLADGPWYVVSKDWQRNIIYVSCNYYESDKKRNTFEISNCNWITEIPTQAALRVKLRHGPAFHNCTLSLHGNEGKVQLSENDQGISAGQFAVFYDNNRCVGTGVIKELVDL